MCFPVWVTPNFPCELAAFLSLTCESYFSHVFTCQLSPFLLLLLFLTKAQDRSQQFSGSGIHLDTLPPKQTWILIAKNYIVKVKMLRNLEGVPKHQQPKLFSNYEDISISTLAIFDNVPRWPSFFYFKIYYCCF